MHILRKYRDGTKEWTPFEGWDAEREWEQSQLPSQREQERTRSAINRGRRILEEQGIDPDRGQRPVELSRERNGAEESQDVRELQESLIQAGYGDIVGEADGYFGPKTERAVRAFQRDAVRDETGTMRKTDWIALDSLLESPW